MKITVLVAGVFLAAKSVVAADIPANKRTTAALSVDKPAPTSDFGRLYDHDWWKVKLWKGKHYAFTLGSCGNYHAEDLQVRNKNGRIIVKSVGCGEDGQAGLEFEAPYSGVYFIDTWATAGFYQGDEPFTPTTYRIESQKGECWANAKTPCSLIIGQLKRSTLFWGSDHDWWGVQLGKGKRYVVVFTLPDEDDYGCYNQLDVRDPAGNVVHSMYTSGELSFTATQSGKWFIDVTGVYLPCSQYTIGVTQ